MIVILDSTCLCNLLCVLIHACMRVCMRVCVCVHAYNSYLPVIGVHEMHEMHGRMHPNYWQITILLVVDLRSSLAYFMMTQPLPIAGKLPIKTLVAKQLPTSICTNACMCACVCVCVCACVYVR